MSKLIRIISVLSILTLSACGGSSSGGGSSSSSDAINDGYQNYSNGVLMAGAQQFIDPPETPIATSQYTSYYNCLANFLEDYIDEPFLYSLSASKSNVGNVLEYCCTNNHFSVNLFSAEVMEVFGQGLNLSLDEDIINEIIVPKTVLKNYLEVHFIGDMGQENERYRLDLSDDDIVKLKKGIIEATSGQDSYSLALLDQIIKDQINIVADDEYVYSFLTHRSGVFIDVYYPNLTRSASRQKSFCDVDVDTLPLTDLGKSKFAGNQAFYCTSTREALAAITNLALWDQGEYSGLCQVSIKV